MPAANKPLGKKAYGSIGHLPESRLGPGDHRITDGQAAICLSRARDKKDRIIVQEKLDGSCVAIARIGDGIVALGRSGYSAASSPYEQHQLFASWARTEPIAAALLTTLHDGERIVGEWLAQAHSTRYDLTGRDPFVAFDLMTGHGRLPYDAFRDRLLSSSLTIAPLLSDGPPIAIQDALDRLGSNGQYRAIDLAEGVVYRVERAGVVDFLAKYVRPTKVDGLYLPEVQAHLKPDEPAPAPIWNWRPPRHGASL